MIAKEIKSINTLATSGCLQITRMLTMSVYATIVFLNIAINQGYLINVY